MSRRAPASRRRAAGNVGNGNVVIRATSPEEAKLALQVDEPAPILELDADDQLAIDRALASVRACRGISLDRFRAILQRL